MPMKKTQGKKNYTYIQHYHNASSHHKNSLPINN